MDQNVNKLDSLGPFFFNCDFLLNIRSHWLWRRNNWTKGGKKNDTF